MLRNERLSFFYLHRKNLEKYIDKYKNNACYFK